MKFSKKGKFKLQEFLYEYGAYVAGSRNANAVRPIEFDKDDFKGCVVLSTKEARGLIDLLSNAEDQRRIPYGYDTCDEWAQLLTNRIKQS